MESFTFLQFKKSDLKLEGKKHNTPKYRNHRILEVFIAALTEPAGIHDQANKEHLSQ